MKSLSHGLRIYILLTIIVLFSTAILPEPAHAWSAVTVEAESTFPLVRIWNSLRDVLASITGKESAQVVIADKGTHQLMMQLAYQFLENDPAYIDQKEYFPAIGGAKVHTGVRSGTSNGILDWEGVVAKTDRAIMEGGEWRGRNAKSGGPDAAGKTKDSYHYYNPRTGKGNADKAVESHFTELLLQMYSQGDFYKREKPNDDTNHHAAWAAHYLGDTYVPHHTVGKFKEYMDEGTGKLTAAQAGPAYLYDWYAAELAGTDINPDSIKPLPEWAGLDNDFTNVYSWYYERYRSDENSDWFDPWYYNGPYWLNILSRSVGLGPKIRIGSHQSWESWAHDYVTDRAKVPTTYSKDWQNAVPEFNKPLANIENQAAMAKAFAVASAKETGANMAVFTKTPDVAFNKATERVATLWRASLTALRPEIKVTPDAANPKLVKVSATVNSVEPNDPATKVKAKLTVDGGDIRGDAVHEADKSGKPATGKPVPGSAAVTGQSNQVEIRPGQPPWVTEWQVDSTDPDNCSFKLEVICVYKKTPDLQYAVCEYSRPLSVTVDPATVEPGKKVMLTVKVSPPQQTELDIKIKPPQKDAADLKDWGALKTGRGKPGTDKNGEFKGEFTVKQGCDKGKYIILVEAPKLKQEGTASLNVGKMDLSWVNYFRIVVTTSSYENQNRARAYGITVDEIFKGSFKGNTFNGELQLKKGETGQGSVTITVEPTDIPTYYKVTDFSVSSQVKIERMVTKDVKTTRTEEWSLAGQPPESSGQIPAGDKVGIDDYGWWVKPLVGGTDTCDYIKNLKTVDIYQDSKDTSTKTREYFCDGGSGIGMGFAESLHEAP